MATTAAPQDVLDAVRVARTALSALPRTTASAGSREEWVEALGALQGLVNEATAVQDETVVALAALEGEWAEDGTVVEVRRAPGHVALDAPAIVSGALCLSAVAVERRVRDAVRRVVGAADGTASTASTGLGGLHAAMRAGRLDGYRAQVVAHELEECPPEVAATVVESLTEWFDREDATKLRRRARRLLARISPDLLRQRAARSRSESGLRRWVDEPGVDTWLGTFPSEEACAAWAAIDALAQRYLGDGVCATIDRARARALTDLVTSNATVDVQVVLTSSAAPAPATAMDGDLVEVLTPAGPDPVLVQRGWLERAITDTVVTGHDRSGRPRVLACDTGTGALVDPEETLSSDAYRPGARLAAFVRARDRHCRFPGCRVAARYCDLDHVRAWPLGPTSATNLVCLCRRHHRVKQRPGWRAVLLPDATMRWTDPTGRTRTTDPVDQRGLVLPDTGTDPSPSRSRPCTVLPDGPHSTLEHHLEHAPSTDWSRPVCRVEVHRPLRRAGPYDPPEHRPRHPHRPPARPETPPF
ncbi:HNH endonuclease signature motif containing protein [Phycicoccus avicenniae]|uniref:HNH endonuclease signature motif containing protein n=1 Tax=Phycicoccus avicenniae TaxID=2828860 RepID=UPI003D292DDC